MRDDRGQVVVLIAAALATLILGVGVAVDTGTLYVARRSAQIAADAAAWAGAVVLYSGGSAAAAEAAAILDASRNGYVIGAADVDVPPTGGPVAGDASFVEVRISQPVETAFFRGPAGGLSMVSVRAVAGATRSGSGEAVLALRSTSTADTLQLLNDARLAVTGSGVHVNSTNASSINIASGTITAPYTRTRGGVAPGDAGKITPAATVSYPTLVADPFASLPGPSTGGLPAFGSQDINNATVTLDPGLYSGGIRIRGASVVTLNPGTYILLGGGSDFGFTVQNSAQVLMASPTAGVLVFNTYSTYPAAPGGSPNCGQVDLNTTGAVTLRARNAGTYAGMVVYQDRSCPTGDEMQIRSTGARNLSGTIAAPYTRTRGNVAPGDAGKITPGATVSYPTLVADPFAGLPGPSTGGLPAFGAQNINNATVTLNPGVYSGGIQIRGTSVVTLNPGTYILLGGGSDFGFTVQNSAQVLMASPTAGVLLFNTYSTYPAAPGGSPNCGQLDVNSTGAITLRARNAGTYAGMVIYQDRSCPAADEMQIRNTGARTITGTIYVANSDLRIRGASTKTLTAQLVARQLILQDNGNVVNLTFSPGSIVGGRVPALYE